MARTHSCLERVQDFRRGAGPWAVVESEHQLLGVRAAASAGNACVRRAAWPWRSTVEDACGAERLGIAGAGLGRERRASARARRRDEDAMMPGTQSSVIGAGSASGESLRANHLPRRERQGVQASRFNRLSAASGMLDQDKPRRPRPRNCRATKTARSARFRQKRRAQDRGGRRRRSAQAGRRPARGRHRRR